MHHCRRFIYLNVVVTFIIFMCPAIVHGMRIEDMPRQEPFGIRYLPEELQNRIVKSEEEVSLRDDLLFLSQQPITLEHKKVACILSLKIIGDQLETRTLSRFLMSVEKEQNLWNWHTGDLIKASKDPYEGALDECLYKELINDSLRVSFVSSLDTRAVRDEVTLYDTHTKEQLYVYDNYTYRLNDAALNEDKVAIAARDNIYIWEKNKGQTQLMEANQIVSVVALHNNIVIAALTDGDVEVFDVHMGKSIALWNSGVNHGTPIPLYGAITAIALHSDMVVIGSHNGMIYISDIKGTQCCIYGKPNKHIKPIRLIALNDNVVVTGADDNTVKIWPLKINLEGKAENNPFLWITYKADDMQLNFICRASAAKYARKELIIDLPKKFNEIAQDETPEQLDGRVYFTMPEFVRDYLRKRLTIRRPNLIQQVHQAIQKQTEKCSIM